MICSISEILTTTETAELGADLKIDRRNRDVRVKIPQDNGLRIDLLGNSIDFEISPLDADGAMDWQNPDRETVAVQFYCVNPDAVPSAVVQYIARKRDYLSSSYVSDQEKEEARAILRRMAGAMGLEFAAVTAGGCDA
jgi:hypothetical protein